MEKILFITNRNILTTSGELRLIKNRSEELYKKFDIITDFLVFQKKERIDSTKKESIESGGIIKTYKLSISNIFHTCREYKRLLCDIKEMMTENNYKAVVFSGPGMAIISKRIKKFSDAKIILDIHGASEDILELNKKGKISKRLKARVIYYFDVLGIKVGLKYADGCFVVTKHLGEYIRKRYRVNEHKMFIIPCAVCDSLQNKEEIIRKREEYRKKYNIDDNDIVFIYSGGASSWQCIEETIELFELLKNKVRKRIKMFCFSHDKATINKLLEGHNNIIVDSFSPVELASALHMGDFAFMLRKNCITNNVAFPNKFLEYIKSGMKIITTPYVFEIAEDVKNTEVGYLYDMSKNIDDLIDYINKNNDSFGNDWNIRNNIIKDYSFETRLIEFISYIKN